MVAGDRGYLEGASGTGRGGVTFASSENRVLLLTCPAMRYDHSAGDRRTIRLPHYDYSGAGAYFVTICTYRRECSLVGDAIGSIVAQAWRDVVGTGRSPGDFVVMPNHVHGIVWIDGERNVGVEQLRRRLSRDPSPSHVRLQTHLAVAQPLRTLATPIRRGLRDGLDPRSLFVIVRTFKSAAAKRINSLRKTLGAPVWQRNYYERVLRNERELNAAREYILDNPRKWAEDKHNPAVFGCPGVGVEQLPGSSRSDLRVRMLP